MTGSRKLQTTFKDVLKEFSERHPEVPIQANFDDSGFALSIPKTSEGGFSIHVELFGDEIIFHCEHFHQHVDWPDGMSAEDYVRTVFGIIYDYLTTDVRLKEKRSNQKPYHWSIEIKEGNEWTEEETNGLIFYNYFGKKTEHVYQNNLLPARMNLGESGNSKC